MAEAAPLVSILDIAACLQGFPARRPPARSRKAPCNDWAKDCLQCVRAINAVPQQYSDQGIPATIRQLRDAVGGFHTALQEYRNRGKECLRLLSTSASFLLGLGIAGNGYTPTLARTEYAAYTRGTYQPPGQILRQLLRRSDTQLRRAMVPVLTQLTTALRCEKGKGRTAYAVNVELVKQQEGVATWLPGPVVSCEISIPQLPELPGGGSDEAVEEAKEEVVVGGSEVEEGHQSVLEALSPQQEALLLVSLHEGLENAVATGYHWLGRCEEAALLLAVHHCFAAALETKDTHNTLLGPDHRDMNKPLQSFADHIAELTRTATSLFQSQAQALAAALARYQMPEEHNEPDSKPSLHAPKGPVEESLEDQLVRQHYFTQLAAVDQSLLHVEHDATRIQQLAATTRQLIQELVATDDMLTDASDSQVKSINCRFQAACEGDTIEIVSAIRAASCALAKLNVATATASALEELTKELGMEAAGEDDSKEGQQHELPSTEPTAVKEPKAPSSQPNDVYVYEAMEVEGEKEEEGPGTSATSAAASFQTPPPGTEQFNAFSSIFSAAAGIGAQGLGQVIDRPIEVYGEESDSDEEDTGHGSIDILPHLKAALQAKYQSTGI